MNDPRRGGPGGSSPSDSALRGEELARELPRLEMPAEAAERVRRALRAELAAPPQSGRPGLARWWPAAAGLILGLATVWFVARPPGLELEPGEGPTGELERQAVEAHARLRGASGPLDLATDSPSEVREWLREAGLSAALIENRPAAEADRFVLRGASRIPADYAVAAVSYRIDGRPVTLAVTSAARAPEVPHWSPLGKTVRVSLDAATGAHVLTWRNAGKAYSLVTELPGRGLGACLLCHTDRGRRELIERLDGES